MAEFRLKTQTLHMQSITGPSGQKYESLQGYFFKVENALDIKYFEKNPRYEKQGLLKKKPVLKKKDVDELLIDKLEKLKGVTRKTAEKVADIYLSRQKLYEAVQSGDLDPSIPTKQAETITEYVKKNIPRGE